MRVLVTGGAGFIGSHLVDALIRRGDEVRVLDNLEPQVHVDRPGYLNSRAEYLFDDLLDEGSLRRALQDVETVYHLAAMVGVGQSMYQIARYSAANVLGTAKLLEGIIAREPPIHRLVVASSMSIYGEGSYECPTHGTIVAHVRDPAQLAQRRWEIECPECGRAARPLPTPETKPLVTSSVYAVTKRDQEELCLSVGRNYQIPTVALRFFNVYGPRQSLANPYTGVAAIFQSRIKAGQPPLVFEDGRQSRDFVSVRDVVQALLLAGERPEAAYHALNVGTGVPVTIAHVAQVLSDLYGSPSGLDISNRYRAGDVRHCFADIALARQLLGFRPEVRFEDGMKELVAWGKSSPARDLSEVALGELRSRGLLQG